jgi:RNase P subunit RPR2
MPINETKPKIEIPKQVSVWCPNCGIPHTAPTTFAQTVKKKGRVRYTCRACGLKIIVLADTKSNRQKDDESLSAGDFLKGARTLKSGLGVFKGL